MGREGGWRQRENKTCSVVVRDTQYCKVSQRAFHSYIRACDAQINVTLHEEDNAL
jgi:hypothetical protein